MNSGVLKRAMICVTVLAGAQSTLLVPLRADGDYKFVQMADGSTRVGEINGNTLITCPPASNHLPFDARKDQVLGPASCGEFSIDGRVTRKTNDTIQVQDWRTGSKIDVKAAQGLDTSNLSSGTAVKLTAHPNADGSIQVKSAEVLSSPESSPAPPKRI